MGIQSCTEENKVWERVKKEWQTSGRLVCQDALDEVVAAAVTPASRGWSDFLTALVTAAAAVGTAVTGRWMGGAGSVR